LAEAFGRITLNSGDFTLPRRSYSLLLMRLVSRAALKRIALLFVVLIIIVSMLSLETMRY